MLCRNKRVITVASNKELLNKHYYQRLWLASKNIEISRRGWLDTIASAFLSDDFYVIHPSGIPYQIPFVDDVFGDDLDMRWISVYLKASECGTKPKHYSRKLERLRLMDLYFKIAHPHIAAHFGK